MVADIMIELKHSVISKMPNCLLLTIFTVWKHLEHEWFATMMVPLNIFILPPFMNRPQAAGTRRTRVSVLWRMLQLSHLNVV